MNKRMKRTPRNKLRGIAKFFIARQNPSFARGFGGFSCHSSPGLKSLGVFWRRRIKILLVGLWLINLYARDPFSFNDKQEIQKPEIVDEKEALPIENVGQEAKHSECAAEESTKIPVLSGMIIKTIDGQVHTMTTR